MHRAFVAAGVFAAVFLVSSPGASGSHPLTAQLAAAGDAGRPVAFSGTVSRPGATFMLRTVDTDGRKSALFGPFTAGPDGRVSGTVPASVTRGVRVSADDFHRATLALETEDGAQAGTLRVSAAPTGVAGPA